MVIEQSIRTIIEEELENNPKRKLFLKDMLDVLKMDIIFSIKKEILNNENI